MAAAIRSMALRRLSPDDGRVTGSFMFYAYYVSTCSGRACGGTLGWHYHILTGSTVTVK
jgi:predicted MFS family arabinose efflux permease